MFTLGHLTWGTSRKLDDWSPENIIPYTYWQALRETYDMGMAAGTIAEDKRIECEKILSTEGLVSYRVAGDGSIIAESSLSDRGLVNTVAWSLSDYDEHERWALETRAETKLAAVQLKFDAFKDQLRVSYPELADRPFGFILNELGHLEATSTDELTDREKNFLDGWLNDIDGLQAWAVDFTKTVIALCKTDTGLRNFEGGAMSNQLNMTQYDGMINLKNIHKFIDFGRLLQNPNSKAGQGHSWVEQLIVNAEKIREQEAESAPRAKV